MNSEILCRLNAKVSQFDAVGISTAGGLTSADVAAACANCDDIGYLALKRRILDDKKPCSGYYTLYANIVKLAQRKRWEFRSKAISAGELRKILDISLDDYFCKFKCAKCSGVGRIPIKEDSPITITCNNCQGEKLRARFDYERAQAMGVGKVKYSRYWKERHTQIMSYLKEIIPNKESEAEYKISRSLR